MLDPFVGGCILAGILALMGLIFLAMGLGAVISDRDYSGGFLVFFACICFFVASQLPPRYAQPQNVTGVVVLQETNNIQLDNGKQYDISRVRPLQNYVNKHVDMVVNPSKSVMYFDRAESIHTGE